jgi:hypothetical protein
MRGGKTLADRGMIPRLLSAIYRRSKKIDKDSNGASNVDVNMSYYEIYNDKVFDLFEAPEKRSLAGLPLRDNGGKTVVVGLTERPCQNLKDFEALYDHANANRSTSATKLNAHSSRSHAILRVKVTVTTGEHVQTSTVSAIDLAGSEDNRRTENGKERMVESASINKSLFVLAQCVEAISKKQARVPYRESKMTRILSIGQNNGVTIMILNLAPISSYHLDTLSSLNFANRTRKLELAPVEPEPRVQEIPRPLPSFAGPTITRAPLRPVLGALNTTTLLKADKSGKAFAVFTEKGTSTQAPINRGGLALSNRTFGQVLKPKPIAKAATYSKEFESEFSAEKLESLVEKKVSEMLAARVNAATETRTVASDEIPEALRNRLERLEERIEKHDDTRAEGLSFLLMAKQHLAHSEWSSALRMYQLAAPFFPDNEKLARKIEKLKVKVNQNRALNPTAAPRSIKRPRQSFEPEQRKIKAKRLFNVEDDDYDAYEEEYHGHDDSFQDSARKTKAKRRKSQDSPSKISWPTVPTPRSQRLLTIINSRNVAQIRALKGVGAKKSDLILRALASLTVPGDENGTLLPNIDSMEDLAALKGLSRKTVENMRLGVVA